MDDDDEEVITTKADTILNSDTINSQKNKTTGPRPRNLHAMLVKRDRTVVSNKYLVNKNQNYNLRKNNQNTTLKVHTWTVLNSHSFHGQ